MNQIKTKNRRNIVIILFLLFFLIIIFFSIHLYKKNQIPETEEMHLIGDGIYFNIYTEKTKESETNGIFTDIDNNSVFYASIQNSGTDRYVSLAGYLNYESVSLEFLDETYRSEQIYLEDGANILIPFRIDDIDSNNNYKFLISLFLGSNLHESDTKYQTTDHTISYDYFIQNHSDSDQVDLDLNKENPIEYISSNFPSLMINTDFSTTDLIKVPPYELVVNKGETFDLAYRMGQISSEQQQLLIVTVNYKQAQINNSASLLIDVLENQIAFGKITLTAPKESGKYEICALSIPDPEYPSIFEPLENSHRFTLTVK